MTESIAASVAATCERLGMAIPHMSFEPGRSISGPSGATLYTVGTIKNVSIEDENGEIRVRRYVSVDGGMSDNAPPGAVRIGLFGDPGESCSGGGAGALSRGG